VTPVNTDLDIAADLDSAASPLCTTCGKCCFGPDEYVELFGDDVEQLGPELVARLTVEGVSGAGHCPTPRFMRMEGGHCAALKISGGKFLCSVYEQRPLLCRIYKAHTPESVCPPLPGAPNS
jgi:Fe-S-cluster containining protein